MKLIVHELKTTLEQKILNHENINVEAIRLHLYKHNNPTGKIKLVLTDETNNVQIAESEEIELSSINPDGLYFHGQVRFYINTQFKKDNYYKIKLSPIDYEFSESNYIGWCADFDFKTHETDYVVDDLLKSPFDYEVWARK